MTYTNPKWILAEFLRNRLTDPRSARAHSPNGDSFTATASQTTFTLSPTSGKKLSCISSVTVDAATKVKWQDYYINFRDEKVIFITALTGGEAVVVNYNEAVSNWIYWDKPNENLTETAFPRIAVKIISGPGERLGNFEAPVESTISFQVDVWVKEKANNQIFTINSRTYTGEDLAEYLAYQVMQTFEDFESDLHPLFYSYIPTQAVPREMPFDSTYQAHHKIVEFILKGTTVGRITT